MGEPSLQREYVVSTGRNQEQRHDERVAAIEEALVTHWSVFGRWALGNLKDENGVLWFETPIAQLPYNMVMRTRIPDDADADAVIERIAAGFRSREVPYLGCSAPPTAPPILVARSRDKASTGSRP